MRPPANASAPPVPIQEAVGEFVGALVDRGTGASKVQPSEINDDGLHLIASYVDTNGGLAALSLADLSFAAITGAALGMIPAAAALEAAEAGELSETLLENYQEVANIMASLLNTPNSPHMRLDQLWASNNPDIPAAVWHSIRNPTKRREFAVTVEGYGDGRIGIIIC